MEEAQKIQAIIEKMNLVGIVLTVGIVALIIGGLLYLIGNATKRSANASKSEAFYQINLVVGTGIKWLSYVAWAIAFVCILAILAGVLIATYQALTGNGLNSQATPR